MAKKISDLTPATQLGDNDSFVFNDVVAGNDKRVTAAGLKQALDLATNESVDDKASLSSVASVADLRDFNVTPLKGGETVNVLSYYGDGNGGGGEFYALKYQSKVNGTASIGSGVSLTVDALPENIKSGQVLKFTGGGIFTLTADANKGATNIAGDLTVANIADNEEAGLIDNGGTVIELTSGGGAFRWKRTINGTEINGLWFGLKKNSAAYAGSNQIIFHTLINLTASGKYKIYIPSGLYKTNRLSFAPDDNVNPDFPSSSSGKMQFYGDKQTSNSSVNFGIISGTVIECVETGNINSFQFGNGSKSGLQANHVNNISFYGNNDGDVVNINYLQQTNKFIDLFVYQKGNGNGMIVIDTWDSTYQDINCKGQGVNNGVGFQVKNKLFSAGNNTYRNITASSWKYGVAFGGLVYGESAGLTTNSAFGIQASVADVGIFFGDKCSGGSFGGFYVEHAKRASYRFCNLCDSISISGAFAYSPDATEGDYVFGMKTVNEYTKTASQVLGDVTTNLQNSYKAIEIFRPASVNTRKFGFRFYGSASAGNVDLYNPQSRFILAGVTTSSATNKVIDSTANFQNGRLDVGDKVFTSNGDTALITSIDSNTQLTIDSNLFISGESYKISGATAFSIDENGLGINVYKPEIIDVFTEYDNKSYLDSVYGGGGTAHEVYKETVFNDIINIGDSLHNTGVDLFTNDSVLTTNNKSFVGLFANNNNVAITLPEASTCKNKVYVLYRYDRNPAYSVTVGTQSGQKIANRNTWKIENPGSLMLKSSGNNWDVLSSSIFPFSTTSLSTDGTSASATYNQSELQSVISKVDSIINGLKNSSIIQ